MKNKEIVLIVTAIIEKNAKILFLKRSKNNNNFKGYWQLPEGKLEFGEQSEQTLIREIKEEIGMEIVNYNLIATHAISIKLNHGVYHLVRIIYKAEITGKIVLSGEHDQYQWVNPQEIDKLSPRIDGLDQIISLI